MEARELRIGNLVKSEIGLLKVESILGSTFRIYCHSLEEDYLADYSINNIQPIPLTEDLLLKMGFTFKSYGYSENEWKQWCYNGYYLNGFRCTTSGNEIQYVHTLQNLYFALTGEELTLKEGI